MYIVLKSTASSTEIRVIGPFNTPEQAKRWISLAQRDDAHSIYTMRPIIKPSALKDYEA